MIKLLRLMPKIQFLLNFLKGKYSFKYIYFLKTANVGTENAKCNENRYLCLYFKLTKELQIGM